MSGRLLLLARRRAKALRREGGRDGEQEARGAAAPRAEVAGAPKRGASAGGDGLLTSEQSVEVDGGVADAVIDGAVIEETGGGDGATSGAGAAAAGASGVGAAAAGVQAAGAADVGASGAGAAVAATTGSSSTRSSSTRSSSTRSSSTGLSLRPSSARSSSARSAPTGSSSTRSSSAGSSLTRLSSTRPPSTRSSSTRSSLARPSEVEEAAETPAPRPQRTRRMRGAARQQRLRLEGMSPAAAARRRAACWDPEAVRCLRLRMEQGPEPETARELAPARGPTASRGPAGGARVRPRMELVTVTFSAQEGEPDPGPAGEGERAWEEEGPMEPEPTESKAPEAELTAAEAHARHLAALHASGRAAARRRERDHGRERRQLAWWRRRVARRPVGFVCAFGPEATAEEHARSRKRAREGDMPLRSEGGGGAGGGARWRADWVGWRRGRGQ